MTVTNTPDPPVSEQPEYFTFSGALLNDITEGKTKLFIKYGDNTGNPIGVLYSQVFTDSVKAGDQFIISALYVPTPILPDTYTILSIIGDPTDDPKSYIPYSC